jgi:hypothetical protein
LVDTDRIEALSFDRAALWERSAVPHRQRETRRGWQRAGQGGFVIG